VHKTDLGRNLRTKSARARTVRAKVEGAPRVVQRPFGHIKLRGPRLAKNAARLMTLRARSNLWMACKELRTLDGDVSPKGAVAAWNGRDGAFRRSKPDPSDAMDP
jgi:hypothetical protein